MSSRRCSRSSSPSAFRCGTLAALLAAGLAALAGCTDTEDVFPANTTLAYGLVNRALTSQQAVVPGNQYTSWTVTDAKVTTGAQTFDFVDNPCEHRQIGALPLGSSVPLECDRSGFSVGTEQQLTLTVGLTITGMELRRAEIPDLPTGGDADNDMVLNEDDNCPILANPMQEDNNGDGVGDLCSVLFGGELFPDQDGDGVRDASDNCKWIANPDQADADNDFVVGDACQQSVLLDFPGGLQLDLGPITATPRGGSAIVLEVDFDDRLTLTCDPAFTSCTLDPAAVRLSEVQITL